jgi:hypothetical protein
MKKTLLLAGVMLLASVSVRAELIQQFKDPTFSGNGWASQVLTLEQMRSSAENSIASKSASDAAAAAAAANNTPMAKFMALFTGQIYSQLATQLTNNLFKECTSGNCAKGDFMITDSQQISWTKAGGNVTLNVFDGKIVNGVFVPNTSPTQSITVPISSFSF